MKIDWQKYNEQYPDRYLTDSYFDVKNSKLMEYMGFIYKTQLVILDIGGGVNGSIDETKRFNHCYLLDPFIENCPQDYISKVDWNTKLKFDIIICRGSFNYLSEEEIKKIPLMLKSQGVFTFNTFSTPSEIDREYTKSGIVEGREITKFVDGVLKHKLMPYHGGGEIIEHDIIYYSPDKIQSLYKDYLQIRERNKNTDIYSIRL